MKWIQEQLTALTHCSEIYQSNHHRQVISKQKQFQIQSRCTPNGPLDRSQTPLHKIGAKNLRPKETGRARTPSNALQHPRISSKRTHLVEKAEFPRGICIAKTRRKSVSSARSVSAAGKASQRLLARNRERTSRSAAR